MFGTNITNNPYTVGWPGMSEHVIAVGVTSHRNYVTNLAGNTKAYASGNANPEGYIVNWSACGPTLDGRQKPDITAPGYNIVSARSLLYTNSNSGKRQEKNVVASNTYDGQTHEMMILSGTSMAAPVMTGIVALWLQANPRLTREDILKTLSRTSKKLEPQLNYPNNTYGYGEVDAYAGLLDILKLPTTIPSLPKEQMEVTMNGHSLYIKGISQAVRVTVYSLSGQQVFSTVTTDGSVELPTLPAAVYAVRAGNMGSTLIRM